jgi:hypothetical protein
MLRGRDRAFWRRSRLEDGEFPADFYLVSDLRISPLAQAVVDRFGAENIILVGFGARATTSPGIPAATSAFGRPRLEFDLGPNLSE